MRKFDPSVVRTLFAAELRMLVRDRRVLVTALLLPCLLMPVLLLGSHWSVKKRERTLESTLARYVVIGPKAEAARSIVAASRERILRATNSPSAFLFEETTSNDATGSLARGELQFLLEVAGSTNSASSDATSIQIIFRGDKDLSMAAATRLERVLRETRRVEKHDLLRANGLPATPDMVAKVSETNVASERHASGLALGRMITVVFMLLVLTGGAVVATDSVAGEKERGTLETLLTTSARRVEIVAAKHLSILAVALAIAVVQTLNLLVYAGLKFIPLPAGFSISPVTAALLLLLYLPAMALASGVLLLLSGRARGYKEAQLYLLPVFLLGLLPALAPLLPGLELRSAAVMVPIANIALSAKELLSGNLDWPMFALAWGTTALAAAWTARMTVNALSAEKLVTAAEVDATDLAGGPALFPRHVLRWFAVLWAVLLLASNYMEKVDLRGQVFINLVVLFFGASCLMMWRYRLIPREALALRAPRPAVWLAVVIAVPSGLLTATGVYKLSNLVFPVSSEILEQFQEALVPEGITAWQLVFFVALMPAIFEEITFRGVLLHGLRKRMHPAALALLVGAIFGLFHAALFRLAPTAALGVMLTAATLLTGSIFPAMLWHGGSNALSLWLQHLGLPLDELEWYWYLTGTAFLAAAFWIMWRNRTPYPGLRPWRKRSAQQQT